MEISSSKEPWRFGWYVENKQINGIREKDEGHESPSFQIALSSFNGKNPPILLVDGVREHISDSWDRLSRYAACKAKECRHV